MTNFEFCRDSIHSKTTESCILLFLCTLDCKHKFCIENFATGRFIPITALAHFHVVRTPAPWIWVRLHSSVAAVKSLYTVKIVAHWSSTNPMMIPSPWCYIVASRYRGCLFHMEQRNGTWWQIKVWSPTRRRWTGIIQKYWACLRACLQTFG